ncbi:hypothetical protein BAE44_0001666 [Dichanthelium oligosanthes]|uniref:Uncharacterized protein n=1 Tax=Dichanthelium oligosanthes TaxID=888268 RepID=A0A1E5WIT6_9POAL|nr:hypothetical protein BAE44_0001666 [Dichanthelium oligosanthes]
MNEGYHQACAL